MENSEKKPRELLSEGYRITEKQVEIPGDNDLINLKDGEFDKTLPYFYFIRGYDKIRKNK